MYDRTAVRIIEIIYEKTTRKKESRSLRVFVIQLMIHLTQAVSAPFLVKFQSKPNRPRSPQSATQSFSHNRPFRRVSRSVNTRKPYLSGFPAPEASLHASTETKARNDSKLVLSRRKSTVAKRHKKKKKKRKICLFPQWKEI